MNLDIMFSRKNSFAEFEFYVLKKDGTLSHVFLIKTQQYATKFLIIRKLFPFRKAIPHESGYIVIKDG